MFELRLLQDDINALHRELMEMLDEGLENTTLYKIRDARYNEMIDEESRLLKTLGLCFDHGLPKDDCPLCFIRLMVRTEMEQMYSWPYN